MNLTCPTFDFDSFSLRCLLSHSPLLTFIYCIRKPKRATPKRTHSGFEGDILVFDHLMHEPLDLLWDGGLVGIIRRRWTRISASRESTEAQKTGNDRDESGANEMRVGERAREDFREQLRTGCHCKSYNTSFDIPVRAAGVLVLPHLSAFDIVENCFYTGPTAT